MSEFKNGIKRIIKKYNHLKGFISLPISGNTREITEELIKAFKRLGVDIITFDLEEKFHHYMQIVNPVFYDNSKQEFSSFVESFIKKDFLYDIVKTKPDFIFSFTNGFLDNKALKVARLMGIKVALYHGKEYSVDDEIEKILKECDILFTPLGFTGEYIDFNTNFIQKILSTGCDIHKYYPIEAKKEYFVTIFGDVSLYRVNIASNLVKKGVKISIFGSGWKEYAYLPEILSNKIIEDSEFISSEKWNNIFRKSQLVLSLPYEVKKDGTVQSKLNYMTFAAAGCGATLIGYSKDVSLSNFTHSEDIMFYENEEELFDIIESLKSNYDLTKFLGLSAVESIRINHTTTKRAEEILNILQNIDLEDKNKVKVF